MRSDAGNIRVIMTRAFQTIPINPAFPTSRLGVRVERLRFRKSQVELGQRFDFELQRPALDIEQMASMPAIGRQEVKMITGDAEGARETGRPNPNQSPIDVGEGEFALGFGCVDQAGPRLRRVHGPGSHTLECSVEPDGVKNVSGLTKAVAARLQVLETAHWPY